MASRINNVPEIYCTIYPVFIHLQQAVSKHRRLRNRCFGPMTPWIVIIQIFILLAETARPRILQPGPGISFLTLQDHFEQAANISNIRIHSKSQNVTALPLLPVQSTNSTLIGSEPRCLTTPLNSYKSCTYALRLLPRDDGAVAYGQFETRDIVNHVLPYALTSCKYFFLDERV